MIPSHLKEPFLRSLRANDKPTPFKSFENEFEKAQSRSGNFCSCNTCPNCVGRYNAEMDNLADQLMTELESE
jgi:ssDNA-binding Zn-finger/Zn-ribbon topoisomerase 1